MNKDKIIELANQACEEDENRTRIGEQYSFYECELICFVNKIQASRQESIKECVEELEWLRSEMHHRSEIKSVNALESIIDKLKEQAKS